MAVSKIPNNSAWKYFGGRTGSGNVDISGIEFSELFIQVDGGNSGNKATFQLPKAILSASYNWFRQGGYYNANNDQMVTISATLTHIGLVNSHINGQDLISTTVMQIFYR